VYHHYKPSLKASTQDSMSDFHKRQQQLMDMSDDDLDDYLAKIDGENGEESGNLTASDSAPIQGSRKTDARYVVDRGTRGHF
jgi:hypothetical protein